MRTHLSHARRARRGREAGAAMLMFIGVAAVLAILAAALLMLVLNTQANTSRETRRTKAFHVAEAALDVEMMELGRNWPTGPPATPTSFADASYRAAFRGTFDATEFPDPRMSGASFVSVHLIDDESSNPYDYGPDGPNGRLIVDAQAVVGGGSARIRALVEAVYYPVPVDKNKAGAGDLGIGPNGQPGAFMIVGWPPDGSGVTLPIDFGYGLGTMPDASLAVAQIQFDTTRRRDILSDAAIEDLVQLAKDRNRYFGTDTDQPNVYSTAESAWQAAGDAYGWEGLIVIDAPGSSTLRLDMKGGANTVYNSEIHPGLLMILDRGENSSPAELTFGGNTSYIGLIYSQATVHMSSTGTSEIIGMLLSDGVIDVRGTGNLRYHYGVLSRLSSQWLTNTRLAHGGWREVRPDPTRAP